MRKEVAGITGLQGNGEQKVESLILWQQCGLLIYNAPCLPLPCPPKCIDTFHKLISKRLSYDIDLSAEIRLEYLEAGMGRF